MACDKTPPFGRSLLRSLRAGAAALCLLLAGLPAHAGEPVRIGWTTWDDAEFVTRLAARVLKDHMNQPVELVRTDIAPQYQGLATGSIDAMLMAWLPLTHADYMDRVRHDLVDLGVLYEGARLGWVVPDYVPAEALSSLGDLVDPGVRQRLGGRIIGIDPGAGLTRLSRLALQGYGIADDYELVVASSTAMIEALEEAIAREEWIVVTGWSPHWKFAAWQLRYLDDPRGELGRRERVHVLARRGLYSDHPEVAGMLGRMWLPIDDLQAALYEARNDGFDAAVSAYINRNSERVRYWATGEMP